MSEMIKQLCHSDDGTLITGNDGKGRVPWYRSQYIPTVRKWLSKINEKYSVRVGQIQFLEIISHCLHLQSKIQYLLCSVACSNCTITNPLMRELINMSKFISVRITRFHLGLQVQYAISMNKEMRKKYQPKRNNKRKHTFFYQTDLELFLFVSISLIYTNLHQGAPPQWLQSSIIEKRLQSGLVIRRYGPL